MSKNTSRSSSVPSKRPNSVNSVVSDVTSEVSPLINEKQQKLLLENLKTHKKSSHVEFSQNPSKDVLLDVSLIKTSTKISESVNTSSFEPIVEKTHKNVITNRSLLVQDEVDQGSSGLNQVKNPGGVRDLF